MKSFHRAGYETDFWYIRDCNPSIKTFRGQMYLGGCFSDFFSPICPLCSFAHGTPQSPNFWCFTIYCAQYVCEKQLHIPRVSESLQKGHNHDVFSVELGRKAHLCRGAPGERGVGCGDSIQPSGWTPEEASRS